MSLNFQYPDDDDLNLGNHTNPSADPLALAQATDPLALVAQATDPLALAAQAANDASAFMASIFSVSGGGGGGADLPIEAGIITGAEGAEGADGADAAGAAADAAAEEEDAGVGVMDVSTGGGIDAIMDALDADNIEAAPAAEAAPSASGGDAVMGNTDDARGDGGGAAALGAADGAPALAAAADADEARRLKAKEAKAAAKKAAKAAAKPKKEEEKPKEEEEEKPKEAAVKSKKGAAKSKRAEEEPKKAEEKAEEKEKKKVTRRLADASSAEEEEEEPVQKRAKKPTTEVTQGNIERALAAGDYMFFRRNARTSRGGVYDLYLNARFTYETKGSVTLRASSTGTAHTLAKNHSLLRYAIYLAFAAVTEEDIVARLCVVEALVDDCGVTPQLSEPADASPTAFVVWLAILAANAAGTGGRGREQDKLREGVWRRRAIITKLLLQHADSWLATPEAVVMAANVFISYDRRECLRELLMTGTARKDALSHTNVFDIVSTALRSGTPWTRKLVITKLFVDRIVDADFITTRCEHLAQTLLHVDAQSKASKGSYIAYFLRMGHSADALDSMDHTALELLQADAPPFAREALERALAV